MGSTNGAQPPAKLTRQQEVGGFMAERKKSLVNLLGPHIPVDTFVAAVHSYLARVPDILQCEMQSVLSSIWQMAEHQLYPDPNRSIAHLIPFRENGTLVCKYIPGFQGLIDLALRDQRTFRKIEAWPVRNDDEYLVKLGTAPHIIHTPNVRRSVKEGEDSQIIGGYAVATFKSNGYQFSYLDSWDIEKIRQTSRSAIKGKGPWKDWFDQMVAKSAVKRLMKMLPINSLAAKAIAHDNAVESGTDEPYDINPDDGSPVSSTQNGNSKADRIAEDLAVDHGEHLELSPSLEMLRYDIDISMNAEEGNYERS